MIHHFLASVARKKASGGGEPVTAKSVVFDIADSWGASPVQVRAIEFWYQGSRIDLLEADFTAYATSKISTNGWYNPEHAFDTSKTKTGGWNTSDSPEWAANSTSTNQRLIVVFDIAQTFDEIVINNSHLIGGSTTRGARNVKITYSPDSIYDTTYDASVSNGVELNNTEWPEHIASDSADDQTVWEGISTGLLATGGTITSYEDGGVTYNVHTFTSSGTFNVLSGEGDIDYLIVGGGGGGGGGGGSYASGGGGGGGGFVEGSTSVIATSYSIVVGSGGAANTAGDDSSAFGDTAVGGGYGGNSTNPTGGDGGSGGGGFVTDYDGIDYTGGAGTSSQGYDGGAGWQRDGSSSNLDQSYAGGGGGAGEAGSNGNTYGSLGGDGLSSSITGTEVYYAGGGGGARYNRAGTASQSSGGAGGGGNGNGQSASDTPYVGTDGRGGGGGGNRGGNTGYAGGSGVVIIRYAT